VDISIQEIEHYQNVVIPNIEKQLNSEDLSESDRLELYQLYVDVLRITARYNFISYNKYLELDEDHNNPKKAFYHQRKDHIGELFDALNDMEIYDKYDILLVSMPPRVGKSTTGIRFLSWIMGRHPESTQLGTSYSDNITTSFYIGVMEIIVGTRFQEVFSDAPLINQNGKREEIWLKVNKRYPTMTFVPVNGSMAGRCEGDKYIYCDDLVSGSEEALSITRMEKLWNTYTTDVRQRKLDKCKEIHIATRWSVHDVISKLELEHKDNPRCKNISLPCYKEDGTSRFDFNGGFTTEYYKDIEKSMDSISFGALYLQQPVEREGLLYHPEDLQYYFSLPNEPADTVIAVCDSKNMGKDFVCSPIGYMYGDTVYIEGMVYNDGLPEVTRPKVGNAWIEHNVVRADVEMNNGGNYYAEDLDEYIVKNGGKTSIRMFFSGNNKQVKIITYADYVVKNFVFKDPSTYSPNSEYALFMRDLFSWTQKGNNKHDDAPDAIAMLAQMVQNLNGNAVKFLDRKKLRL
jgi:predicted phage terminase large subunit-like protein